MKKRFMLTLVCLMAAISWVAAKIPPLPVSLFQLKTMNRLSELPYW